MRMLFWILKAVDYRFVPENSVVKKNISEDAGSMVSLLVQ